MRLGNSFALAALLCSTAASAAFAHGNTVSVRRTGEQVVVGSGRFVTDARNLPSFTRIVSEDATDVEVRIGSGTSVELEADDNLVGKIGTSVENGTLLISSTGSYSTTRAPKIRITMPSLSEVDLRGSSDARISGLGGGTLDFTSIGSGDLSAEGRLDRVEIRLQGSGDVDLTRLGAGEVDIVVNGSGDANVGSPRSLTATVNGSGSVSYDGEPRILRQTVNGTGHIGKSR
jgi:hypothetical protein